MVLKSDENDHEKEIEHELYGKKMSEIKVEWIDEIKSNFSIWRQTSRIMFIMYVILKVVKE
jgi:hypothetical protein